MSAPHATSNPNNCNLFLTSERKKQQTREEAWQKIEEMASRTKPEHDPTPRLQLLTKDKTLNGSPMMVEDPEFFEDEDEDDEMQHSPTEDKDSLSTQLSHFEGKEQVPSRFRRKSVLPVDADVVSELSRHKSLEDLIRSKTPQQSE
jgi:serine/threonine-protein phosphatase 2A regulatory subunit B'